jgi:hypothetical protein
MAYAAVPCALAAWTGAVAGNLAALENGRELSAASGAGLAPARWLWPLVALACAMAAWAFVQVAVVFPTTRALKHLHEKLLLRSPETSLRLFGTNPGLIPSLWVRVQPTRAGSFEDLWAVEHEHGEMRGVWRARRGRVEVPAGRDVLGLELDDVEGWLRRDHGVERLEASRARLEYPLGFLASRGTRSESARMRERSLAELHEQLAVLPRGELRRHALAESASRWCFAFAPLALVFAGAGVGLRCARAGAWGGMAAGIALVGAVFLPVHSLCKLGIGQGLAPAIMVLPAFVACLCAWALLRWGRP